MSLNKLILPEIEKELKELENRIEQGLTKHQALAQPKPSDKKSDNK